MYKVQLKTFVSRGRAGENNPPYPSFVAPVVGAGTAWHVVKDSMAMGQPDKNSYGQAQSCTRGTRSQAKIVDFLAGIAMVMLKDANSAPSTGAGTSTTKQRMPIPTPTQGFFNLLPCISFCHEEKELQYLLQKRGQLKKANQSEMESVRA